MTTATPEQGGNAVVDLMQRWKEVESSIAEDQIMMLRAFRQKRTTDPTHNPTGIVNFFEQLEEWKRKMISLNEGYCVGEKLALEILAVVELIIDDGPVAEDAITILLNMCGVANIHEYRSDFPKINNLCFASKGPPEITPDGVRVTYRFSFI